MSLYHMSVKTFSRGKGHSAGGAMSYRAGEIIYDERQGVTHDYSLRHGVVYSTILTPINAPEWATDRQSLANRIEAAEKRKDARLLREVEVGLQREMTLDQHIKLLEEFVEENITNQGMIADISIHNDPDNHNPHAHILLTTRELNGDDSSTSGFAAKKNRDWDKKELLQQWREKWQEKVNDYLDESDHIDHRTLQAQGITDRVADKHYGKHAWNALDNERDTVRGTRLTEREAHYNEISEFLAVSDLQFDDHTAQEMMLVRQLRNRELIHDPEPDKLLERQTHYNRVAHDEQERGFER